MHKPVVPLSCVPACVIPTSIESVLENTLVTEVDGVWTLLYESREYVRLLDAVSREDAEQQIAEMLFLRSTDARVTENPAYRHVCGHGRQFGTTYHAAPV